MKCPHCVNGKVELFSSIVDCEECGGSGELHGKMMCNGESTLIKINDQGVNATLGVTFKTQDVKLGRHPAGRPFGSIEPPAFIISPDSPKVGGCFIAKDPIQVFSSVLRNLKAALFACKNKKIPLIDIASELGISHTFLIGFVTEFKDDFESLKETRDSMRKDIHEQRSLGCSIRLLAEKHGITESEVRDLNNDQSEAT